MRRLSLALTLLVASLVGWLVRADAGAGKYPVVLIHGWTGSGTSLAPMVAKLRAQGFTVVDFDPTVPGVQALTYAPTAAGQHIPYLAAKVVQPKIKAALKRAGYNPDTQKIDVVAHSMGGLIARFLVEHPGADVDRFDGRGWYGDGVADVDRNWAARVDDLIMLGTPNHGTWEGWVPGTLGGFGVWNASGGDMRPRSAFLTRMGYTEPAGESYAAVGGNPSYGQYLRFDYTGDGVRHGFDGVVPAESPYVTGAAFDLVGSNHGELLTQDAPLDIVIRDLGYRSTQTGGGVRRLHGSARVRLEYAQIGADHDPGSDDENRFDVYVDRDGGNDDYAYVGTIGDDRDAPFTQAWGNHGPLSPNSIDLPGTSAVLDVKVVVWESDPVASDTVGSAYFTNITLSDDRNGQDYYSASFVDAAGGIDRLRISVNGVTAHLL